MIHTLLRQALQTRPTPPVTEHEAPSVADLLAQSRAAHHRSFQHRGRIDKLGTASQPNYQHAGADIQQALSLRLDAEALDPTHKDPAWLEDQAANKGQTNEQMVAFLGRYLSQVAV